MDCDISSGIDFEFEAPQFVESWEVAANVDDGADRFFDALESLEARASIENNKNNFNSQQHTNEENELKENKTADIETKHKNKIAEDVENICVLAKESDEEESTQRRLSLKRKASPLKDRNELIPLAVNKESLRKFKNKTVLSLHTLSTIPESPVLLTKTRVRPKTAPEPEIRPILKPVRKKNFGVCLKPLPKPPTIPEPFNLTEPGKNVHNCCEDDAENNLCTITPSKRPIKKNRLESTTKDGITSERKNDNGAFSFYERDKEIMKRKLERMNGATEDSTTMYEFRAKSPSVLKKEPFWPTLKGRPQSELAGPCLSTPERGKRREQCEAKRKTPVNEFGAKKLKELEEHLFVFKAQPAPKGNSSFISTASSSKNSFFDTSMAERMNHTFKAKEAKVLLKDPFWPEIESRFIKVDSAPVLATIKRAEERQVLLEEKLKKEAAENERNYQVLKKIEQEELRKIRKKMEFKATRIKK